MGTFDMPHPGHVALFRECRKLAGPDGKVVVTVNRDAFVARFKTNAPVMTYGQRAEVVSAIRYVDEVLENTGKDQPYLIETVRPDLLVIGVDWAAKDYYHQLGISPEWLAERQITLVYVAHEHTNTVSSTKLRERMTPA